MSDSSHRLNTQQTSILLAVPPHHPRQASCRGTAWSCSWLAASAAASSSPHTSPGRPSSAHLPSSARACSSAQPNQCCSWLELRPPRQSARWSPSHTPAAYCGSCPHHQKCLANSKDLVRSAFFLFMLSNRTLGGWLLMGGSIESEAFLNIHCCGGSNLVLPDFKLALALVKVSLSLAWGALSWLMVSLRALHPSGSLPCCAANMFGGDDLGLLLDLWREGQVPFGVLQAGLFVRKCLKSFFTLRTHPRQSWPGI